MATKAHAFLLQESFDYAAGAEPPGPLSSSKENGKPPGAQSSSVLANALISSQCNVLVVFLPNKVKRP